MSGRASSGGSPSPCVLMMTNSRRSFASSRSGYSPAAARGRASRASAGVRRAPRRCAGRCRSANRRRWSRHSARRFRPRGRTAGTFAAARPAVYPEIHRSPGASRPRTSSASLSVRSASSGKAWDVGNQGWQPCRFASTPGSDPTERGGRDGKTASLCPYNGPLLPARSAGFRSAIDRRRPGVVVCPDRTRRDP